MTATFVCRSNSHPFQERRVSLAEPVKIGRSVARAKPAANNAIFDCKVLSRNHALLWYENGKFHIKDTKSSNGTFVNNHRLSKGSEESLPFEVNSGDIVQFGVDVVENSRKVTHGCIVSQIRLYLPNGEEAKQSDVTWTSHLMEKVPHNLVYPIIQSQDLYQLHQYLQEALHREQMLEQKLALLQRLVADSHEISEKGWQALIDEDKLLSRLEFLENQISTYTKTMTEEITQKELLQLQKEKHDYETTSKETLRQVLQEKLEAVRKLCNLERSFSNTEDECSHLREVLSKTQQDLKELAEKHQLHVSEAKKLSEKAQEAERDHSEVKKRLEIENENHLKNQEKMKEVEEELRKRLEDSQDEYVKAQNQIQEMKSELERLKNSSTPDPAENNLTKSEIIASNLDKVNNVLPKQDIELKDITVALQNEKIEVVKTIEICESPAQERMNVVEVPLGNFNSADDQKVPKVEPESTEERLQNKILETLESATRIEEMEERITELQELLAKHQSAQLEEEKKRKEAEERLNQLQEEREKEKEMLHETTRELQAALSERESLLEREDKLRTRIQESEKLLQTCDSDSISSSSEAEDLQKEADLDDDLACGSLTIAKAKLKELKKKLKEKEALLDAGLQAKEAEETRIKGKTEIITKLEDSLVQSESHVKQLEGELKTLLNASEESAKLREDLEDARKLAKEQCRLFEALQQDLRQATEKESEELRDLQEQLQKEKKVSDDKTREVEELRLSATQHVENYQKLVKKNTDTEVNLKRCLEQISTLENKDKSEELASKNKKLEEEKENLLSDMRSLREKLEEQQKSSSEQLETNKNEIKQEFEEKLKGKQAEIHEKDARLSKLLDKQQKLIEKLSSQTDAESGRGARAIHVAILAVAVGIVYALWPQLVALLIR